MKRHEYERALMNPGDSLMTRYLKQTSHLDALLADLKVRVNLYEDGSLYRYRILDADEQALIEGLNPAYANAGDYRRIVLALRPQ